MTSFRTSAGNELKLTTIEGTVLSVEDRENVVVNQDPGTTRYNATLNQTFKQAGDIYSEIVKTSKVWIREHSGKERQVDISDTPVPLRAGHQLRVFKVSKPEEDLGYYWAAKNLNTDEVKYKDLTYGVAITDALGVTKLNRFKELLVKPAVWAVLFWLVVSIGYYFSKRGPFYSLSMAFGDLSIMLFSFIPFAFINAFIPRKDYIKTLNEITAHVKTAVAA